MSQPTCKSIPIDLTADDSDSDSVLSCIVVAHGAFGDASDDQGSDQDTADSSEDEPLWNKRQGRLHPRARTRSPEGLGRALRECSSHATGISPALKTTATSDTQSIGSFPGPHPTRELSDRQETGAEPRDAEKSGSASQDRAQLASQTHSSMAGTHAPAGVELSSAPAVPSQAQDRPVEMADGLDGPDSLFSRRLSMGTSDNQEVLRITADLFARPVIPRSQMPSFNTRP